jgi:hypothetical protein
VFAGRPLALLLRGTANRILLDGEDSSGAPIELAAEGCQNVTFPLGALWARERVAWLEDRITLEPQREKEFGAQILALALEHRIASRLTAFVAVEERVSHTGERVTVVQPVELPQLWSESFRGSTSVSAMPPGSPAASVSIQAMRAGATGVFPRLARQVQSYHDAAAWASLPDEDQAQDSLRDGAALSPPIRATGPPLEATPLRALQTMLATTQDADGSFGGSVERTATALVTLVRLGHTRRKGARRRVVQKAARWLAQHSDHPMARLALDLLSRAETGGELPRRTEVEQLLNVEPEGPGLDRALQMTY